MLVQSKNLAPRTSRPQRRLCLAVLFGVGALSAAAQPVIGIPVQDASNTAVASDGSSGTGGSGGVSWGLRSSDGAPIRLGFAELRPHFSYRFTYGDGIQSQPGNPVKSSISEIAPGVRIKLGDNLSLNYTATETLYSDPSLKDFVAHALSVSTGKGKTLGQWLVGFSQSFGADYTPMVETGGQTKSESASTGVTASRELSRKISVSLGISQSLRFAGALGNTLEWATSDGVNYALSNRLKLGVTVTAGYSDLSRAANSTFHGYSGQANWKLSDKLGVTGSIGQQSRDTEGTASTTTELPTYALSFNYHPLEFTNVSLSGTRSSSISLYQNLLEDTESWRLNVQQRFLGKIMFNAGYGHQSGNYSGGIASVAPPRADSSSSWNLGMSAAILKRGNVSLTYQQSRNESNVAGFGFSSGQVSAQVGYSY